ncbi:MAG: chorismate-binding protein [Runella sp.]
MLYAGGGITEDSDPLKEWQETELKFQTLERVLA